MAKYPRKRSVERIRLAFPILGRIGTTDVVLLDVSLHGCRIEHTVPLKVGNRVRLLFHWEHERLDMEGEVVRSNLNSFAAGQDGLTVYHSGIRFASVEGVSVDGLRKLITEQITRALAEQKANARGDLPKYIDQMAIFTQGMLTASAGDIAAAYDGETSLPNLRIARDRGYLSYSLDKNQWRKRRTRASEQPDEGFTVWAYEDEDQLALLCKAYERGDESFRSLIRLLASMSLIVDDTIPPQRFQP